MAQNKINNKEFDRSGRLDDKQRFYTNEPQGNNNDDTFESGYENQQQQASKIGSDTSSGRSSRGSNESSVILSSCEIDGDDSSQFHDSVSEFSSTTSGRSSADQPGDVAQETVSPMLTGGHQLNKTSNLIPRVRLVLELVDKVRVKFLEEYDNNEERDDRQEDAQFEHLDLEELRKELPENPSHQEASLTFRLISRFINFNQLVENHQRDSTCKFDNKELIEIVEKLADLLKFRHHYQLTDVTSDQFCKEIYQMNGLFQFGHDRNMLPVIYIRARIHRKWSPRLDDVFRRYVAWQINSITKSYNGARISKSIGRNGIEKDGSFGICFDCLHVSYSCLDMDFLKFLVKILVHHYPTYCRYAVCVDLPWLFRSVWKLVRSWLPEEAQNTVQLITSKQLIDFISEDQIPNSIQYNDNLKVCDKPDNGKHRLPKNFDQIRAFDELADELNLTSSESKQFKSHMAKVIKEYEQLGAI